MTRTKVIAMLLLLAGVTFLMLRQAPLPDKVAADATTIVSSVQPDALIGVSVISANQSWSAERAPESLWELRKPVASRVAQEQMSAYLERLFKLEGYRLEEQGIELTDSLLGIAVPTAVFRLVGEEFRLTLLVGRQNPVSGRYYVKVEGVNEYYLVDQERITPLFADFQQLREHRIMSPESVSEVQRILLFNEAWPDIDLRLERAGWQFYSADRPFPTNSAAIEEIISQLATTPAERLVDIVGPDLSLYGLDPSATTVHLELRNPDTWGESQITLRVGTGVAFSVAESGDALRQEEAVYISSAALSVIFRFPSSYFSRFHEPIATFRGPRLLASPESVRRIVVSGEKTEGKAKPICANVSDCGAVAAKLNELTLTILPHHIDLRGPSHARVVVFSEHGKTTLEYAAVELADSATEAVLRHYLRVEQEPISFVAEISADEVAAILLPLLQ